MPSKKPPSHAIAIAPQQQPVQRAFGNEIVVVDAVYKVPSVHPTGPGPWADEADKVAWTDAATGFGCIIRRSPKDKCLSGYVGVPPGHPFHGRHTDTLHGYGIGVHGGLDYSAACQHRESESVSICHVPRDSWQQVYKNEAAREHDDLWWLGFSCNHPGDAHPSWGPLRDPQSIPGVNESTYKDEAFVARECVRLARQLKAIAENRDPREADPGPSTSEYDPMRTKG